MTKTKRLFVLAFLFVLLGGIYWGVGNTPLTVPVTYLYYALCLVLSVLYILVSGGIQPILEKDREKEEKVRKKYLADKGALHPVKRKDKYRRFRIKKETDFVSAEEKELPPAPNLLHIPEEKRGKISMTLLLLVIPFYLIFLLDFLYLRFFI